MSYKTMLPALAILASGISLLTGQQPVPTAIFTSAQAEAGRVAFHSTCGKCHTTTLMGRKGVGQKPDAEELPPISSLPAAYQEFIGPKGYVAPLAGEEFLNRWGSKTAAELIARFQETVPQFPPEGMDSETTVNITAYVLQVNGAKAGSEPLTRTTNVVVRWVTR